MKQALTAVVAAAALTLGGASANAAVVAGTSIHRVTHSVSSQQVFKLRERATHVAVSWRGAPTADLQYATSRDGKRFGQLAQVELDDAAAANTHGQSFGSVVVARGARYVKVRVAQPLQSVSVTSIVTSGGVNTSARPEVRASANPVAGEQPAVISRANWGANEALRFKAGVELFPREYYPVQKLVVHHTDGSNIDPDPASTVRAIYAYHAADIADGGTEFGDVGYNFLIDREGRIYEGRHGLDSYDPIQHPNGPTGADEQGNGVTGAHALGFNSGTAGVALLGTFMTQRPTDAALNSLRYLLAWEAKRNGLDPLATSIYKNPVSGTERLLPTIIGHQNVNGTDCPGVELQALLPQLRTDVAALLAPAKPADPPVVPPVVGGPAPGGSKLPPTKQQGSTVRKAALLKIGKLVRKGTRLKLSGKLDPAATGSVVVQLKGRGKKKRLFRAAVRAGAWSVSIKLPRASATSKLRITVVYSGSSAVAPAKLVRTIRG